ncbi:MULTISPECIES: sigma-70 family RNA polymerase sigma factor [Thermomonosporaceae]|uniref:sigma-70 family RNA polymerase sigma factor n=1 Tax=Thermomonosporaceae TaxID=2012 RepID=UPI00255AD924|nr:MULTISPECIES: sigma-70 family RNA polymerase sigma factor [Thermomonosporaceae]MDL4770566.1 sigma-70 family RNA polymerase sigma factor [Actinomadura xylanilytica]
MDGLETEVADPPGDPRDGVAALFHDNRLKLLRLAVLMVGDEATAEDVVQDAFIGLHRRWSGLDDERKAPAYARASVLNGCRSVLRRRSIARRLGIVHEPPVWSAESEVLVGEERRGVMEALQKLPRRRREVLVLRYYLDLGDAEIAEAMGIAEVTVRTTAARALTALARLLGNQE